jgi:hypothetical protein
MILLRMLMLQHTAGTSHVQPARGVQDVTPLVDSYVQPARAYYYRRGYYCFCLAGK